MFKTFATVILAGTVTSVVMAASPAAAQATNVCQQIGPMMQQRQSIIQSINAMGRKNVNPATACARFNSLVSNGQRLISFLDNNKDWCQIPDEFANNVKSGQGQAVRVRNQACNAASQQAKAQRQARAAAQGQGGPGANPFGGADAVTGGAWRVPQGAL